MDPFWWHHKNNIVEVLALHLAANVLLLAFQLLFATLPAIGLKSAALFTKDSHLLALFCTCNFQWISGSGRHHQLQLLLAMYLNDVLGLCNFTRCNSCPHCVISHIIACIMPETCSAWWTSKLYIKRISAMQMGIWVRSSHDQSITYIWWATYPAILPGSLI